MEFRSSALRFVMSMMVLRCRYPLITLGSGTWSANLQRRRLLRRRRRTEMQRLIQVHHFEQRLWVMVWDSGVRVTYLDMFVWFLIFFVIRPFFWFILSKREECHRFGCLMINDTIKSLRYIKSLLCQLISSLSDYQPKMCARWIPIQHFSAHWVYSCSSPSSCASSSLPPAVPAVEMVEPRLNLIWLLNQPFRSSCAMWVQ